jgi:hypothetical protein
MRASRSCGRVGAKVSCLSLVGAHQHGRKGSHVCIPPLEALALLVLQWTGKEDRDEIFVVRVRIAKSDEYARRDHNLLDSRMAVLDDEVAVYGIGAEGALGYRHVRLPLHRRQDCHIGGSSCQERSRVEPSGNGVDVVEGRWCSEFVKVVQV